MDNNKAYHKIDESLGPFSEIVSALSGVLDLEIPEEQKKIANITIESMNIDMPVEMDVIVDESGEVTLGSSPPTQYIETTFMPTFNNIKMTIVPLKDLYGE